MALRVAVANGNWSNPSTWYLGVKPAVGDIVASNGYTVTIDENVNVDTITNTAQLPVSIIPLMTSNTTPEGVASSNNIFGIPTYDAFKAFDRGIAGAGNHWLTANNPVLPWLEYQFSSPKIIVAYSLENNFNNLPNTWQFQAWNGSAWVVLDTVTGNTSNSYQTRTFTNTTAYTRYRIYITAVNGTNAAIGELRMFDVAADTAIAVAGGTFNMGGGVNVTCTGSIPGGATTVLTWNGGAGTTSSITATNIFGAAVANINNIVLNGTGTLNINARITGATSNVTSRTLTVTNNGIINLVGNIEDGPSTSAIVVLISSNCTFNITGNITNPKGSGLSMLTITAICTVNITGNVINNVIQASTNTININAAATVYVTGSVRTITTVNTAYAIATGQAGFLSIVGSIEAGIASPAFLSTSGSAINLFSGPFISSTYGFFPFLVTRMHLIPTTTSYFEFRDETTNGAVQPGAIAPATQLVSPATIADNPIPADVRLGTVYSIGSQTGTLNMPHPNQVTYGVAVDNTFGNAVLTAASVWDYLVASITVENSIGMRLKNVATPQTVGAQLASLL